MPLRRFVLLPLALAVGGCSPEPTACDGFADRHLAITASEYRGCAGEILDALDAIERPLRAIVKGSATAEDRDASRRAYDKLQRRILRTGIEDDYRSTRPGTVIIKWAHGSVSAFNRAAVTASVQYGAVLSFPSADNFAQGVRAHDDARRHYRTMR